MEKDIVLLVKLIKQLVKLVKLSINLELKMSNVLLEYAKPIKITVLLVILPLINVKLVKMLSS